MSEPLWTPKSDAQARLLGLAFLAAGAAILYWQVGLTLREAEAQAPELTYSLTLIVMGTFFAVAGAMWCVHGLAAYQLVRRAGVDPKAKRILTLVAAGAALAAWGGMTLLLSRLGYR